MINALPYYITNRDFGFHLESGSSADDVDRILTDIFQYTEYYGRLDLPVRIYNTTVVDWKNNLRRARVGEIEWGDPASGCLITNAVQDILNAISTYEKGNN